MGNVTTSILDQAAAPEQREAWSRALEAEQRLNGTAFTPAAPSVTLGGKVVEFHAGSTGGADKVINRGVETAIASPGVKPGHVIIGGVETTVEAAIAAGLMERGDAPKPGFSQPVQPKAQAGAGDKPAKADDVKEKASDTTSHAAIAAKEASETLDGLDQALGSHVVDAALNSVVESGYYPEGDELPEGVTSDHVNKIVAGYTAQANATLADVGASVPMLMEVMSDAELREARSATITNDTMKMQHLGRQAVERLASLPETDPAAFAEMLVDMKPEERKVLSQNDRGEWIIALPGKPVMSYAAAVRQGIVRV